jgi:hypothetical protein
MQLFSPNFMRSHYHQSNVKTPSLPATRTAALMPTFQAQPTETFTKMPRFNGLKPYTDSKGNTHEYIQTDIDDDALPHAETVFKEGIQQYKAMYQVFYLAAYIGDTEKVKEFLKKGYDPTIRKSTDENLCTMLTRKGRTYEAPYWLPDHSKGKSARDLAEMKKHHSLVAMMDNHRQLAEPVPRKTTIKFQLPSTQPEVASQSQPAESPVTTPPNGEKDSRVNRFLKIIHLKQHVFTP